MRCSVDGEVWGGGTQRMILYRGSQILTGRDRIVAMVVKMGRKRILKIYIRKVIEDLVSR